MAKNFSKFLGKIALMTAAALWAACNDSDKKTYPIKPKKGELSKIYRDSIPVKTLKPDLGGFIQNQNVALYGVPSDVVCENCPRGYVPRCRIKPLSGKNIVIKGLDIDVQSFLKVYRQRVPGLRYVCNKNIRNRSDSANEFEGKIVLTLNIASSGEVGKVEITSTTIAENSPFSAMNEEIKESVSHWMFPKTQTGGTITFPINLYEIIPFPIK
ncbi:hypothetical protein [Fibrobacter sp.]|uniref:hypothetical protein n=1 Tax=Fibrobacter sp. TaxID=35828 RepID=UPI003867D602